MYERKIAELMEQLEGERARASGAEEQLASLMKLSNDNQLLLQVWTGNNLQIVFLWFNFIWFPGCCTICGCNLHFKRLRHDENWRFKHLCNSYYSTRLLNVCFRHFVHCKLCNILRPSFLAVATCSWTFLLSKGNCRQNRHLWEENNRAKEATGGWECPIWWHQRTIGFG